MSLEAALEAHTAALKENTAAVKDHTAALGALKAAAAAKAGTTPPAADKPKAADKPADKPKTEKKITADQVKEAGGDCLAAAGPEAKPERRAQMKKVWEHYGAAKLSEIPEKNFAEAIADFQALKDGNLPSWMAPAEADEDAGMLD